MLEVVNGTVIGPLELRNFYRFYSGGRLAWEAGHFDNDANAIAAFHTKFAVDPILHDRLMADGIEIRAYN